MESSTFFAERLTDLPLPLKSNQTYVGVKLLLKEGFLPVSVRKLIATCDFREDQDPLWVMLLYLSSGTRFKTLGHFDMCRLR